jgi:hypothetical protein
MLSIILASATSISDISMPQLYGRLCSIENIQTSPEVITAPYPYSTILASLQIGRGQQSIFQWYRYHKIFGRSIFFVSDNDT